MVNAREATDYPPAKKLLPGWKITEGRYWARFAHSVEDLDAILKLRFEVFNLELGEGLDSAFGTGRDLDEFDAGCHHLIVRECEGNAAVGTYRMQTAEMARAGRGFYSASEFDLSGLPSEVLDDSVELGRACIALPHRNTIVLFLLWKGLAAYIEHNRRRYLFGCSSLTSQDPALGLLVMEKLRREGHYHPTFSVPVREGFKCEATGLIEPRAITIPRLFRTYLRYGAKVCSPPAIDRAFKTIDFLVTFDVSELGARTRQTFFGS